MKNAEALIRGLPDPEAAERFLNQFTEKYPSAAARLRRNDSLMLDVLTLASFSPLLAATMLQSPEYTSWLGRKRSDSIIRNKEELLESLARFSLTNSQLETHVQLARFRRRELLRIFLRDIRGLTTMAEITEEISSLADAILEHALRIARQDLDNRYGSPFATDEKGRTKPADFCVVSLGKLGSKELNYASDIDLLFIYSDDGTTAGGGSRAAVSNREYFAKLAEAVVEIVGRQKGEGAAYRVDLRLRPHGRVGPLAMSLKEIARYYKVEAAMWERQVLIRCRASSGDESLYRKFFSMVESSVFSPDEKIENALENVRLSKQKIDMARISRGGFDVKLGHGGIREIEFIAQALQLAHGGRDKWLRAPHTLISLQRLADRQLISEHDLTELFDGYEFFRRVEHRLQMENGLQTHTVPDDPQRRRMLAARMGFAHTKEFDRNLRRHSNNIFRIFSQIFGSGLASSAAFAEEKSVSERRPPNDRANKESFANAENGVRLNASKSADDPLSRAVDVSWRAAEMLAADPERRNTIGTVPIGDYRDYLLNAVQTAGDFGGRLATLRRSWETAILEIIIADVNQVQPLGEIKLRQTELAEASIAAALFVTKKELEKRFRFEIADLPIAILGLGKLGGGAMDYDSDLDIVIAFEDIENSPIRLLQSQTRGPITSAEFNARAVEILINTLSALTRDGNLYRVDLRLRPFGKDGPMAIERGAFADYMKNQAAIWELLAFVKLRGVGGKIDLAKSIECEIRENVHQRARKIEPALLASETIAIRDRLERQMAPLRGRNEVDIKFGSGGMLDIYFATRFLQLRDNIPDDDVNRTTIHILGQLRDRGSLSDDQYRLLFDGYRFLSRLDHALRLTVGRRVRIRLSDQTAAARFAKLLEINPPKEFLETLQNHRSEIRRVFDAILDRDSVDSQAEGVSE